jgi:hypothetical protein
MSGLDESGAPIVIELEVELRKKIGHISDEELLELNKRLVKEDRIKQKIKPKEIKQVCSDDGSSGQYLTWYIPQYYYADTDSVWFVDEDYRSTGSGSRRNER